MFPSIPSNLQQLKSNLTTSNYFSEATQKYAKIAAVVFAIFGAITALFFIYRQYKGKKLDLEELDLPPYVNPNSPANNDTEPKPENVFSNELSQLPEELWRKIYSYIPPRDSEIPYKMGGVQSGLEKMHLSKQLSEIAKSEEKEWASEQLVSLKKYRCNTAKEAVQYVIDHGLTGANLREFPDVEESDIEELFKQCPNLNQLIIKSDKIRNLPDQASSLIRLDCSGCANLQSLPELPNVQELNCRGCSNLQSLPELPNVQELNCRGCSNLQSLPELPNVQKLYCRRCFNLQSLPELPNVQKLDCSYCSNLQSLPELPNVQKLDCSGCYDLQSLPELPNVQKLNCREFYDLQSLPELPNVQELNCYSCFNLQSLPELPNVQKLNCNRCSNLQSLPELPNVQELDCRECSNLQSLPKLPNVQVLRCSGFLQLKFYTNGLFN